MVSPLSAIDLQRTKATLQADPAIDECVILNRPTIHGEQHLLVYIVPGEATGLEQMYHKVSTLLAEVIGISSGSLDVSIIFLSSLPLTPSGEIDEEILTTFPVSDDKALVQWETYLQHYPEIEQVAVVHQEYTEPPSPVHLMDLLKHTTLQQEATQNSSAIPSEQPAIAYGGARREDIDVPATLSEALMRAAQQRGKRDCLFAVRWDRDQTVVCLSV